MDDPNEEFVFYLEVIQCKLEGNRTLTKILDFPEPEIETAMSTKIEKVTTNNICSIIINFLYNIAKSKSGETVLAGTLKNLQDFEIYKKKDIDDFAIEFEQCLEILVKEGILINTSQTDIFSFNSKLLERLGNSLYERLKNEDQFEFSFDEIYNICNGIVSPRKEALLSKDFVFRVVSELFKMNKLYKADKNQEKYGVS